MEFGGPLQVRSGSAGPSGSPSNDTAVLQAVITGMRAYRLDQSHHAGSRHPCQAWGSSIPRFSGVLELSDVHPAQRLSAERVAARGGLLGLAQASALIELAGRRRGARS